MVVVDRDNDRLLNAGGEQPGAGRQWASIATEPGSVTVAQATHNLILTSISSADYVLQLRVFLVT